MPGFGCVEALCKEFVKRRTCEEEAPMVERLQREAELGLVYDESGGVSDPEAAQRTVFRAMCRPICGDGVANASKIKANHSDLSQIYLCKVL